MDTNRPKPSQLKAELGISGSYASMILSGNRKPPMELALRIHERFGLKMGPVANVDDEDIPALRRAHLQTTADAA